MKHISIVLLCLIFYSCTTVGKEENNVEINDMGIHEKTFIEINGLKQGMFIKGNDRNNPIILFLHGGPGMPTYGLTEKYPTYLEQDFIVCWWEQRGTGLSYSKSIKPEQLCVKDFVSDIFELTEYLRKRFNKDKIYLMGHSWGSYIGLLAIKEKSELFHAYIGVGQITNPIESEKLAYKYILEQYKIMNNRKMVEKMEKHNFLDKNDYSVEYEKLRDNALDELGIGMMHEMKSGFRGLYIPIMKNKEYTFSERRNIWKGKSFYMNKTGLLESIININLFEEIKSVDLPVYFFHGKYDYAVNYELAKEYCKMLESPIKGFYTFYNSAHSPIFEEPKIVRRIMMEDVIHLTNQNSDKEI